MDEQRKREILDQARDHLDRLADLQPRARDFDIRSKSVERRAANCTEGTNQLTEWERSAAATAQWQEWVGGEIREAMRQVAIGIAEEVREALDQIDAAIHARDDLVKRLDLELVKAQAQIAKLELRLAEDAVARDRREREWSPTLRRETIN
jgi:hypothetical protein